MANKPAQGFTSGKFQAKGEVRDKLKNKSYHLSLDLIAVKPDRLRVNVFSYFGNHIASFAMKSGQIRYILVTEKRYVSAPATEKAFHELMRISLEPSLLLNVLFDDSLPKDWKCETDRNALPTICRNARTAASVQWQERSIDKRVVVFDNSESSLSLVLRPEKLDYAVDAKEFELNKPAGFQE